MLITQILKQNFHPGQNKGARITFCSKSLSCIDDFLVETLGLYFQSKIGKELLPWSLFLVLQLSSWGLIWEEDSTLGVFRKKPHCHCPHSLVTALSWFLVSFLPRGPKKTLRTRLEFILNIGKPWLQLGVGGSVCTLNPRVHQTLLAAPASDEPERSRVGESQCKGAKGGLER